jgi:hypothetical protein
MRTEVKLAETAEKLEKFIYKNSGSKYLSAFSQAAEIVRRYDKGELVPAQEKLPDCCTGCPYDCNSTQRKKVLPSCLGERKDEAIN